jgi:SOS-response transcriptional repressor LexA
MYPTLKDGQLVFAIKAKTYKIGQIVVAKQTNLEVIKRIAEIDGDYIRLLGDNLAFSADSRKHGPVKNSDILGRVVLIF